MRDSPHGLKIKAAEEEVDRIGSTGSLTILESACDRWVSAWELGIESWKQHIPRKELVNG